jgi:hypothetical protein
MKIAIIGGLGLEKDLQKKLSHYPLFVLGSSYHIEQEKFEYIPDCEFIGEYLTHNYQSQLSEYDLFIDASDSLKSKFTANDIAVKLNKGFITLYYDNSWKVFVYKPGGACLSCFLEYKKPRPAVNYAQNVPLTAVEEIIKQINPVQEKSFVLNIEDGKIEEINANNECPAYSGKYKFALGEMADVVSVSCGDNSVAVTPMNDNTLDLKEYKTFLNQHTKIVKETPFFLEFKILDLDVLLFRQSRLIVKGTKEKNTALYIYRWYVGN